MTGSIARKILIYAAVDGLVVQPLAQRQRPPSSAVKISYSDNSIIPTAKNNIDADPLSPRFEAFGIIGLLTVNNSSFLITIIRRKQVAQIHGNPIYVVTEIAITPLSSQKEANTSISQTQRTLRTVNTDGTDDSDDSAEENGAPVSGTDDVEDEFQNSNEFIADEPNGPPHHKRVTSVAEDVIARKGGYGRFAKNWFSKEKWRVDNLRNLGLSGSESDSEADSTAKIKRTLDQKSAETATESSAATSDDIPDIQAKNVAANLLPKLLKTTRILFGSSRSYYFSYDYDITRNLASRSSRSRDFPLHAEVDPHFFWNRSLIQPFISSHQDTLVLPLMQGFIGQRRFMVSSLGVVESQNFEDSNTMEMEDLSPSVTPNKEIPGFELRPEKASPNRTFLLTLISRRSVKRAGLRYLRRGIDDAGNVANSVETEQILSDVFWATKTYSFSQIRGSIPVFFSQSPYSFKPVPQMQHSFEKNATAFQKHFSKLGERYGNVAITSLVEKHGNEALVGGEYEKHLLRLNEAGGINGSKIPSRFWDFHAETRGMKFENVATLMDMLGTTLDNFGYSIESEGKLERKQIGILRTNCMDCLDRTNVVQSAAARRALEIQLRGEGVDLTIESDTQWFNMLWADNGDAISKQYASTAALKGDFTRTRKRNYQGALNDLGLSISRFYSGIVNDYFLQTSIDFLIGNVTSAVFEEFEADLMSEDPGISLEKLKQQAIDLSYKLVVEDEHEEFIDGWTMLSPREPNTIKSTPFKEIVLLLTDAALYACRFDWNLDKVSSFERVDLSHITNIKYGTYITSTLSAVHSNEAKNVGFVVTYEAGKNDVARVNTRSLSTSPEQSDLRGDNVSGPSTILSGLIGTAAAQGSCILAAKVLPSRSAVVEGTDTPRSSEIEQVKQICGQIERMVLAGRVVEAGTERKTIMEEKDIISLSDAKKNTGLIEQLGYSIKKLVWA